MNCPKCGSYSVIHSRWRGMEIFLQIIFFPVLPFICKDCCRRVWIFSNPLRNLVSQITAGMLILFFGLPFAFFQVHSSRPRGDLKPIERETKGLLKNAKKEESLISKARIQEAPRPPDYELNVNSEESAPVERKEIILEETSEPIESAEKKIPSKWEKSSLYEGSSTRESPWYLHVSSFKYKDKAEVEVQRLKKKGYEAFALAEEVHEKNWFRVYSGEFDDEKEARRIGSAMREKGAISYFKPMTIENNTQFSHGVQSQAR